MDQSFEIPSTYCHLARASILLGREAEASDAVAQAWSHRTDAPPYVAPRILWFQTAFALLDGIPPTPFLGKLKTALQTDGAIMEWAMDPVLAYLQPNLNPFGVPC